MDNISTGFLRRRRVRFSVRNSAVAFCAVAALTAMSLGGAPAAVGATAPAPSASHPYSDPVWWPLHAEVKVDCAKHNPGCSARSFYAVDVVPTGQKADGTVPTSKAGVYAMGAGIAHIGNAKGDKCGKAKSTNYGTWVWIDHGAGVISRYGHLASAKWIKEGQLVRAGDRIGTVGTTGKRSNCNVAYTDFMLRPKGVDSGLSTEFSTKGVGKPDGALSACGVDGAPATWPGAVVGVRRWEDVPKGTTIPATDGSCIPSTTPATAKKAAAVKLKKTSTKHSLKASWSKPASTSKVDTVLVELSAYHPTTKAWDKPHKSVWKRVAHPTTTSATFTKLVKKHKYRVRVWFHNAAGWSAQQSWVKATAP